MARFGDYIKKEREKNKWTQTDLGAKIGINSSAISRIEKGTQQLSPEKLVALSEVFGVEHTTIKELYYADKFAWEAYKSGCSEAVFCTAEKTLQFILSNNAKQSKLTF